jgi:hypothetical protein
MKSLKLAIAGVFAFALVVPASTAWAGNGGEPFDRPDLMDVHEEGDLEDGQIGNWEAFSDDTSASNQAAMEDSVAYGGFSAVVGGYDADFYSNKYSWTQAPTGYNYTTYTWLSGPPYYGNGNKYYFTNYNEGTYTTSWTNTWWDYDYDSDFTFAEIRWVLAQPDKVQLTHKRKKVRQKDYVGFVAIIEDHVGESERVGRDWQSELSTLFYYGSIAGCKGKMKVKDTTPDPNRDQADAENCGDWAKWKIRCNQDLATILAQLQTEPRPARFGAQHAMTADTVQRFLTLIGATGTETVIKGKDTNHACDPADDDQDGFEGFDD